MKREYDPKSIEKKWQTYWEENQTYEVKEDLSKPKYYILDMFPYPSGEGLHVGHPKGYIATDIVSRMRMMQGFNVLHPMGWDAFGLPAENYALKTKTHPKQAVQKNIEHFKRQLEKIGFTYDWSREINTTDPNYYRWTQWCFLQMFKKGLVYESYEPINWCPSCKTGLANEDLENGRCERCDSEIERKPMRQWVIKITEYAERLLQDIEQLTEWEDSIKDMQRAWIGKSEGLLFEAPVIGMNIKLQTFSAHFEACYADTFVAIAPDHPLLPNLLRDTLNRSEVEIFCDYLIKKRSTTGHAEEKESEGIFTGRYIKDPLGNGDLPIWVASFALADYGTGIVKCSAHDERDFAFAKKYGIPLKIVLLPEDPELKKQVLAFEECYSDMTHGILTEPAEVAGMSGLQARSRIIKHCVEHGFAQTKTSYKIRDWVFSRQRYWGEPIPIIHCETCGPVGVPQDQLPVILPDVEQYEPTGTGESPLAAISEWVNTTCPSCKGHGKRETNTMPQWAGSSWYYLRYADPHNTEKLLDQKKETYWLPVDLYVGGAEHATRHLIYARFWHKFLKDINIVSTNEPFKRLYHVGLIMGEDNRKMSKRWGNVINPDEIIERFGADTLRMYEMFMGPFSNSTSWNTNGLIGIRRFLERVTDWFSSLKNVETPPNPLLHKTIKKVTDDIENFHFNTAVSKLMIFVNETRGSEISRDDANSFLQLLAPLCPFLAEELWEKLGNTKSIFTATWPQPNISLLQNEKITLIIQINSKVRETLEADINILQEDALALAQNCEKVKKWLSGKHIKNVIFVPKKLLNIITE